jgi:hypothetical protein
MSFAFGQDETFDLYSAGAQPPVNQPHDITLSYNVFSEALKRTTGASYGVLIAGDSADHTLADAMTDIDIHHSFFANNKKQSKCVARMRFINNIIYNWGSGAAL